MSFWGIVFVYVFNGFIAGNSLFFIFFSFSVVFDIFWVGEIGNLFSLIISDLLPFCSDKLIFWRFLVNVDLSFSLDLLFFKSFCILLSKRFKSVSFSLSAWINSVIAGIRNKSGFLILYFWINFVINKFFNFCLFGFLLDLWTCLKYASLIIDAFSLLIVLL